MKFHEVTEVQGIALYAQEGWSPEESYWTLQYTNQTGEWFEMKFPLRQGLYLLGLLETASREKALLPIYRPPK